MNYCPKNHIQVLKSGKTIATTPMQWINAYEHALCEQIWLMDFLVCTGVVKAFCKLPCQEKENNANSVPTNAS